MTPEGKVKKHLATCVAKLGGKLRYIKWIGRRGAPDILVLLPGRNEYVETKAKGGVLSRHQANEIAELRRAGCCVSVLPSIEAINAHFPAP